MAYPQHVPSKSGQLSQPSAALPAQPRRKTLMRKYEVASLGPDGRPSYSDHIAPATLAFESAFASFARGTMISTVNGPCAVEDLEPGMVIETRDGVEEPVLWIGRMMLTPSAPVVSPAQLKLTRIMADSFGLARPMPDLVLGHAARLAQSPAELREYTLQTPVLTPAHAFIDGENIVEVHPPSPIALYHIGVKNHAILRAAGLELETFHPGLTLLREMSHNTRHLFLSLFPHIDHETDFGPLSQPRAGHGTLRQLSLT